MTADRVLFDLVELNIMYLIRHTWRAETAPLFLAFPNTSLNTRQPSLGNLSRPGILVIQPVGGSVAPCSLIGGRTVSILMYRSTIKRRT
jgi:hypothetical protein